MAGEIQLNSTTMATESSGSITAQLDTIRPNTTNGSLVLQGDSSDAGVTGLTIDNSGNATFAQTISGGTIGSSVVFPDGHVIGFKFVEIGNQALSGTYTKFNTTTAATSSQGLQVVSTTYDPKSDDSLIYVMANLTVTESSNNNDEAYAALFVGTNNLSQAATQDRTSEDNHEYTVANLSGTFTNSAISQLTVQVRASGDTNEGLNINGMNGDNPHTNSVAYYYKTGLTIMEIKQ